MINVFRKIWFFSGEEKGNLKKSIIAAFACLLVRFQQKILS